MTRIRDMLCTAGGGKVVEVAQNFVNFEIFSIFFLLLIIDSTAK